jgi:hypothetical protein
VVWVISNARPQRATSAAIITERRGSRSTKAPASAPNRITGSASNTTAMLTDSPELVREKINATRAT